MKKNKREASYFNVKCYKCAEKFRSNPDISKKPLFICPKCYEDMKYENGN